MILSMKTENIKKDLKNLEDIFDFSNLDENHELYSNKNKKVINRFKIETPKNTIIDEAVCLRSKAYSFKCKDNDESKNKIERISKSQSKHIKFEEYKKCLDGMEYQNDAITKFFVQIIMKCIFKKLKNQHYQYSMINDVI